MYISLAVTSNIISLFEVKIQYTLYIYPSSSFLKQELVIQIYMDHRVLFC